MQPAQDRFARRVDRGPQGAMTSEELTQAREAPSRQRRELPWVKIDKDYVFDGPDGKVALGVSSGQILARGAARDVRTRMGRGMQELLVLGRWLRRMVPHLAARDTTMVAISRAQ